MVAHLAYIQLVQSSSLWSQTNLLSHSFTSYYGRAGHAQTYTLVEIV